MLTGFPEAIGIPGLLDAIGLDADEELVAMEEDRFIAASRDLNTTLSSPFSPCILFAIVEQLYLAEILGAASGAEMADIQQIVSWEESSRVTKVPLAESRRLFVTESSS